MGYSLSLLEDIYAKCLELPLEQRHTYIVEASNGNNELQEILLKMLSNQESSIKYFQELQQTMVSGFVNIPIPELEIGEIIGNYSVISLLGKGGMSNVYLAERSDGEFEQLVAIKCFSHDALSNDQQRTAKIEQQILAKLKHPNIATLLDAGVTDQAVLYFIMEYIDGKPIDKFIKESPTLFASVSQRLALFKEVAEAVAYAHTRFILHLDLKPSNILVQDTGQVKLLDFGIATTLQPHGRGESSSVGTPSIAAPEQMQGNEVTVATDIYQLGLLLHLLIADHLPLMEDVIEHSDVTRMSLNEFSPHERIIDNGISFELKAILSRCLELAPQKRYINVAALLQDIDDYQLNYPVSAVKPTKAYYFKKYLKRNQLIVLSMLFIGISMLTGIIVSTSQAKKAKAQRDIAIQNEQIANATKDFLTDLFTSTHPSQAKGDTMNVYQFLDKAYAKIDSYNGSAPIKLEMLTTISQSYRGLGDINTSKKALDKAFQLAKDSSLSLKPNYIRAVEQLGLYQRDINNYDSAKILLNSALTMYAEINYPQMDSLYTATLRNLSYIYKKLEIYDTATLIIQKAIKLEEQIWPDLSNINLAESYYIQAAILKDQGLFEEAVIYQQKSLALCESLMGENFPGTMVNLTIVATLLTSSGDYEGALNANKRSANIALHLYGSKHQETITALNNLGFGYFNLEQYDSALLYFHKILALQKEKYGTQPNNRTHGTYNNLLSVFVKMHQNDSAMYYLNIALGLVAEQKSSAYSNANTYNWAAYYYKAIGAYSKSKTYFNDAKQTFESFLAADSKKLKLIQADIDLLDSLMIQSKVAQ